MVKALGLNVAGIYTITCTANGTVYVGQARNVRIRWHNHRWHLDRGTHRNAKLLRAWKKYGAQAFVFSVVLTLPDMPEPDLVARLNTEEIAEINRHPRIFNLLEAGDGRISASRETRDLWSKQRKEMWSDPEFRERRAINHKKACADPEVRRQRGESLREVFSTEEQKRQRSEITKARWAEGGDLRASQGEKRRANWQDPAYREQQRESRSKAWQDPEIRARRTEALKAAWVRRRARMNAETS